MKKTLSFLFTFVVSLGLFAQNIVLKGVVRDSNGDPIFGVSVRLANTSKGTSTDMEGAFALRTTQEKGELIFSFVGMKTIKQAFQGNATFLVTLEEDIQLLEGIKITAKQNINEIDVRAKTGNVEVVAVQQLKDLPVSSIALALQGKATGLRIINRGEVGATPEIRI